MSEKLAILSDIIGEPVAYQSVADKVLARIWGNRGGKVFSAVDFLDLGSRSSIDQSLSRLAKRGEIRRLGRGFYDYPKTNKKLGSLSPASEEIARAITRKNLSKLQPSGSVSANALGLSTQVPTRIVYRTLAPSKEIRVGRQLLEFRRTTPKNLEGAGRPARAVIEALRHVGRRNINTERLAAISQSLSPADKRELRRLKKNAPGWMHGLIDTILNSVPPNHGRVR